MLGLHDPSELLNGHGQLWMPQPQVNANNHSNILMNQPSQCPLMRNVLLLTIANNQQVGTEVTFG